MNEITKLKRLVQQLEKTTVVDDGTWLDHLNPSQAFLTCIGAGPWKIKRRTLIQKQAVKALGNKDLCEINDVGIFQYPLKWQNQKVNALINYLNDIQSSMDWLVNSFKNNPIGVTHELYSITKTRGRAKVLDLFVRDYLKLPAFPIDRWVKRLLKENKFPINETYMIKLCQLAELDVGYIARLFVNGSGKFSGNGEIKTSLTLLEDEKVQSQ